MRIISIATLLLIIGCTTSENYNYLDNKEFLKEIALIPEHKVTKELLNVEEMLIIDSILIIRNYRNDSIFTMYLLPDFKFINSFGSKGKGPGEYLLPHLVRNKNEMIIYDTGIFFKIDNNFNDRYEVFEKLRIRQYSPLEMIINKDKIIFDHYNNYQLKLTEFDSHGNERLISDFKELNKKLKNPTAIRGFLNVNDKTGDMVYVYQFLRRFDIFDKEGNLKKINTYKNEQYPLVNDKVLDSGNSITYYFGVTSNEESIFLYYIGLPGKEIKNDSKSYIEEYDWEGNPKSRYKIDRFISNIIIWNNQFICIDPSLESPFIIYNI